MRKTITNEDIIVALLSSSTIKESAALLHVQEKTLYHRMKDKAFIEEYRQARADLVKSASMKLQHRLSEAIDVQCQLMKDESAPPQVRLSAAEAIIKRSISLFETVDLTERVEELERQTGI